MNKILHAFLLVLVLFLFFMFALGSSSTDETNNSNTNENVIDSDIVETTETVLEYIDEYMVANYDYLSEPLPGSSAEDAYLKGTILDSDNKWMSIQDSEGNLWTITFTSQNDLRKYNGTVCEVYAGTVGGISKNYNTPLLFITEDKHHFKFYDGKEFYPEIFASWQDFDEWDFGTTEIVDTNVWIPTDGGNKYHSKSTCSGMESPRQVSKSEAIDSGYSKCGKCW